MSPRTDKLMREFRGDLRAPLPLHPLEKALLVVAALNVCSLPWMLGGMRPWAQFISLGLSVAAFGIALVPRNYDGDLVRGEPYRMQPVKKLLRWPLFWIGLVFFGYVLIQALNPAWEFVQMEKSWGMKKIAHVEWLPTGMRTPFEMMNPWRQMMIWGAPFLLVCALWAGFTRRKSVITLLTAIVINATVLAIVGIVARYTANGMILWATKGIRDYAFSSFIYKNHAGGFFTLAVGLALALAVWHHSTAVRGHRRSSPASLFLFLALLLLVAVLQTYSRAAILIIGGYLLIFGTVAGFRLLRRGSARPPPLVLTLFCVGFVAFASVGSQLVNSEKTMDRIRALTDNGQLDRSVISRQIAWDAGYDMSEERPTYGWGAGGFRFLFPRYQMSRPEIVWADQKRQRSFMFWEHAHNDYLQLLIETGRTGWGLVGGMFIAAVIGFGLHRGLRSTTACALLGAAALPMAHAAVDFPMQNPAILTTLFVVAGAALALPGFENRRA